MKRDYARKKHKSRYRHPHSYWRLWLGTVTLFVLFTLGLVYLGKHYSLGPMVKISSQHLVKESSSKQVAPPKIQKSPQQPKQPHFDFYTTTQN